MRFRIPVLLGVFALGVPAAAQPPAAPPPRPSGPFPAVSDADSWSKLPPRKNPPLPEWARVLTATHPKTAAKMLELDYLHRVQNPLGPVLAARIRAAVAETLGCEYGVASAKGDPADPEIRTFRLDARPFASSLTVEEQVVVEFAKKLTKEGHAITDKEFEQLLKFFGPEKMTAIVHTVAYANFHNRILLGLGVKGESPPAPAFPLKFDPDAKVESPPRPPWDDLKAVTADGPSVRVEWSKHDFEALNKTLESQKERGLRIPLPDRSRLADLTGRDKEQSERIVWMTVSTGYQPEMTRAWFACLNAFYEESKPDRVFTNSVFWVVTRTNDCFY